MGWSSSSQFMPRDGLLGGSSWALGIGSFVAVAGAVGLWAEVSREVARCWRNLREASSWALGTVLPVLSIMLWASFLRISLLLALVLVYCSAAQVRAGAGTPRWSPAFVRGAEAA